MTDPSRFPITPRRGRTPAGETLRPVERADVGPLPGGVPTPIPPPQIGPVHMVQESPHPQNSGNCLMKIRRGFTLKGPAPSPASRSMLANAR